MFAGIFSFLFSFFSFFVPREHAYACFWGFFPFFCTPGTRRRVSGVSFSFSLFYFLVLFFCLFSFFAPPGHAYACFGGLFILFLSLHPGTRVTCVFLGVFSFLFFVLLCTPATRFDQQTRVSATYNPNPHVLTTYDPPATRSLAPQAPKRTYEQSYVRF